MNRKGQVYALALEISEMDGFVNKVIAALPIQQEWQQDRIRIVSILKGELTQQLNSFFLKNNNHTDPYYLTVLKKIQSKISVPHSSAILSLSLLQAYTQDDSFIKTKENFQWVSASSHWARFSAIASLGLIWKGNLKQAKNVFNKFLPQQTTNNPNYFVNGGALFGLGLVYQKTNNEQLLNYILGICQNPSYNNEEPLIHGACLSLGLIAFASGNQSIYYKLKDILNTNSAVTGQASALAIGLVMAGTNNSQAIAQLISFGNQTEHQKITRSIALALSFITIQTPSQLIEELEKCQALRIGIPLNLATSYFATSNAKATHKLLNLSCDLNNDIKRMSIICLGFVLYNDPELINVIQMMITSFNPHIRYGCSFALAIGGRLDQIELIADLIWSLLVDPVQFVRQSAYISLALIIQQGALSQARTQQFIKLVQQTISKRHEDVLCKMGAILALGLMDVGGRNMSISIKGPYGVRISGIVGILTFCYFWYWFPFINFIGLSLQPNVIIGINEDLKIPKSFKLRCKSKKTTFAYLPLVVV